MFKKALLGLTAGALLFYANTALAADLTSGFNHDINFVF